MNDMSENSVFEFRSGRRSDERSSTVTRLDDDQSAHPDGEVISRLDRIENLLGSVISTVAGQNAHAEKMPAIDGPHRLRSSRIPGPEMWNLCYEEIYYRKLRDKHFPELQGEDTAWFILLDLGKSEVEGRPVYITSACLASFSPATTALRHIGFLVDLQLCLRSVDVNDRRRHHLTLSDEGRTKLQSYVREKKAARERAA